MSLVDPISQPNYLPQGECYAWDADILWLHVGANTVIASAFVIIPAALLVFVSRHKYDFPHRDILYLFVAFIFFCGLAHAAEVAAVWYPIYPLRGWLLATTASVCLITALVIIPKLPEAISGPSPTQMYEALEQELQLAQMRVSQMSSMHEASLGREDRITELKKEVNAELLRQGQPARYNIIDDRQR